LASDVEELFVVEVSPATGSGRLLVHIVIPDGLPASAVLTRLRESAPRLRAEVARSINRKRAPELSFVQAAGRAQHE
jgi:hypothetical protein